MTDHSSQQAAPDEGAASPRLQDPVTELREALDRYDWWPEGDPPTTTSAVLNAARELLAALDVQAQARTIRTVEQLDALPEGAVVRRGGFTPRVYERASDLWLEPGNDCPDYPGRHMLPAVLLWHPDWSES